MIQGTIETIAFGGEGILRHEGLVLFVPFTAPGDKVKVRVQTLKKNFAKGELLTLLEPSSARTPHPCPHFGSCGGCQLQHLKASAQIEAKRTFIQDALERIGRIKTPVCPVAPAEKQWAYRRHIRLKLKPQANGFCAGFIGADAVTFVPITDCPLFLPLQHSFFQTLSPFLAALSNTTIQEGALRLIKLHPKNTQETPEQFLLVFHFPHTLPKNSAIAEQFLQNNPAWQGIIMHSPKENKQWGNPLCNLRTLGLDLHFSPLGFIQCHPEQSDLLYQAILSAVTPSSKKILDLYCGIGITSLLLAKQGKEVVGIETHAQTIELAKKNAKLNQTISASFHQGKAESLGIKFLKTLRPDVVICNPPRTGLSLPLIQALIQEKPAQILYISCMPSTLARDLKQLIPAGYAIKSTQGFDLFPQTTHVETLVVLNR